jgi:glutamyl-tRNA reductase
MPNVTLYNLEDIKRRVDQNLASRQQKMKLAFEIIDDEVAKFNKGKVISKSLMLTN